MYIHYDDLISISISKILRLYDIDITKLEYENNDDYMIRMFYKLNTYTFYNLLKNKLNFKHFFHDKYIFIINSKFIIACDN